MEQERDEARESVSTGRLEYHELKQAYRKETDAHNVTKRLAFRLSLVVVVLLLVVGLLTWRLRLAA